MDRDCVVLDAVDAPVGFVPNLAEFFDADFLQFGWDMAAERKGAERTADILQRGDELVSVLEGIVQGDVAIDLEQILSCVEVELNVILFHS
jgi:hypothetical protein